MRGNKREDWNSRKFDLQNPEGFKHGMLTD